MKNFSQRHLAGAAVLLVFGAVFAVGVAAQMPAARPKPNRIPTARFLPTQGGQPAASLFKPLPLAPHGPTAIVPLPLAPHGPTPLQPLQKPLPEAR